MSHKNQSKPADIFRCRLYFDSKPTTLRAGDIIVLAESKEDRQVYVLGLMRQNRTGCFKQFRRFTTIKKRKAELSNQFVCPVSRGEFAELARLIAETHGFGLRPFFTALGAIAAYQFFELK